MRRVERILRVFIIIVITADITVMCVKDEYDFTYVLINMVWFALSFMRATSEIHNDRITRLEKLIRKQQIKDEV